MNYDIYRHARDMAWKFLIDNNVTKLPVNLLEICRNNGYHLLVDEDYKFLSKDEKGVTFLKNGNWYILLNPSDTLPVRRYTIAHELGHIYLNHLLGNSDSSEYEAERFAIDILAPACVLWGLNLHTAEEIASVCDISMQSAQIRAERMKLLYKRNRFLTSPLEKQVFEQFKPFIDNR